MAARCCARPPLQATLISSGGGFFCFALASCGSNNKATISVFNHAACRDCRLLNVSASTDEDGGFYATHCEHIWLQGQALQRQHSCGTHRSLFKARMHSTHALAEHSL